MAPNQQDLRDVEELEQQFRSDPSPEVFIPLGEVYLRRGFPLKAIEVCRKGLKASETAAGQLLLAQAYLDASAIKGNYIKDASETIENIISQGNATWEAYRLRGEIALVQDDVQGAIQALQKTHELNPEHPQARMLLQSLGVDIPNAPATKEPFYINVETGFVAPQEDSLLKSVRDVVLFFIVIFAGVYLFAQGSILEKKVRAMILLGRTQQNLNSYKGLQKAAHVYTTVRKEFDGVYEPFSLIHLSEVNYALWKYHDRKDKYLKAFKDNFIELNKKFPLKALKGFAMYEALKATVEYNNGMQLLKKGELDSAKQTFERAAKHLKSRMPHLPIDPRVNLIYGLLKEALQQRRHARAHLKRAAELGWNNPLYRWRLAHHYLITRAFAAAHSQYKSTEGQARQATNYVTSFLSAPDKQKNEYCWIDPTLIFGSGAGIPKGLELGTFDLLTESLSAAMRAEKLSKCPFHPYFQKQYKASPEYLPARSEDVLSVLDSGVGMSAGFELAEELDKHIKVVKKAGDLSPLIEAGYYFAKAKAEYFKNETKKAQELLDKALKLGGEQAFFMSLQGLIQVRNKKYDDAVASFKKAFKASPYLMQSYIESIEAFLSVKDDEGKYTQGDKVETLLKEMKSVFGEHSDYLYLKGRLEDNKGNGKVAEELWTKALDDQKGPYFGEHYDANIAMGKLWMKRAFKFRQDRKLSKKDYPELVKAFKLSDKKIRKNIKRDTLAKALKEAYEQYDKFLAKLKDGKRASSRNMKLYLAALREALYEEAGAYFQSSMTSRPGAVEGRMQTALIYFHSKSWNDSTGHFTVAATGYLRDLDYKGAVKAYTYLAAAQANAVSDKPRKKRKEKAQKVLDKFKLLATAEMRKAYLKVSTAKSKPGEEKKKKKMSDKDKQKLLRTLGVYITVLKGTKLPKPITEFVKELEEDSEIIKTKGIISWYGAFRRRAQAKASGGKRRRRRR